LVENEKGEKKRTATEGLMWLLRGLSFTCKALQNSQANKAQELSAAFTSGYEATLKKFHGILVRPIFTVSYIASLAFFLHDSSRSPAQWGGWTGARERGEIRSHLWICRNLFFFWLISGCRALCLTLLI
jgi:hypothetical protein